MVYNNNITVYGSSKINATAFDSKKVADDSKSDVLRLKARKKAQAFWETHASEGLGFTCGMGVCFKGNPDIISYEELKPLEYQIVYDVDWIKKET